MDQFQLLNQTITEFNRSNQFTHPILFQGQLSKKLNILSKLPF